MVLVSNLFLSVGVLECFLNQNQSNSPISPNQQNLIKTLNHLKSFLGSFLTIKFPGICYLFKLFPIM